MTKHVLITGCSTGIGLATAHLLQNKGYKVVATCRKQQDCDRLKSDGLMSVLLDVNSSESIQTGFDAAMALLDNQIDILINNAGYAEAGAVEDISRTQLRQQFETNVFGLIELTQKALPIMRQNKRGTILNISSILGVVAIPYKGAYVASKYAVDGITDTLRMELRGSGINVILLNPGPIDTHFRINARQKFSSYDHFKDKDSAHKRIYDQAIQTEHYDKIFMSITADAVARKIHRIIRSPFPRARYFITLPAHAFAIAKRILPVWLQDLFLSRIV